jgi:hypothetical protein
MKDNEVENGKQNLNGSIPFGDLKNIEDALNNSYWKEILLKYAKTKKIESYILLMNKMILYRKLESNERKEESKKILEEMQKLNDLKEDEKEIEKIKQRMESQKEESIQSNLFDDYWQKIHNRIQTEHWNEFKEFSIKEDEKIHLKDAVELMGKKNLIHKQKKKYNQYLKYN